MLKNFADFSYPLKRWISPRVFRSKIIKRCAARFIIKNFQKFLVGTEQLFGNRLWDLVLLDRPLENFEGSQPYVIPDVVDQSELYIIFVGGNLASVNPRSRFALKQTSSPDAKISFRDMRNLAFRKPQPLPARSRCLLAKSTAIVLQNRTMSFRRKRGTRYLLRISS